MMELLMGEDFSQLIESSPDIMQHVMAHGERELKRLDAAERNMQKLSKIKRRFGGEQAVTNNTANSVLNQAAMSGLSHSEDTSLTGSVTRPGSMLDANHGDGDERLKRVRSKLNTVAAFNKRGMASLAVSKKRNGVAPSSPHVDGQSGGGSTQ
jgi:hypothetical protein